MSGSDSAGKRTFATSGPNAEDSAESNNFSNPHNGVSGGDATDTSGEKSKAGAIAEACGRWDGASLAKLATSKGGLLTDSLRRQAWPALLGCHDAGSRSITHSVSATDRLSCDWMGLPEHRDEEQVGRDVDRSFVFYPESASESELQIRRAELSGVIIGVLRRNPELCYFQGFHDIVQVLLLVLGLELTEQATPYLALLRIRDFMLPSLTPSLSHLQLLPAILYSADQELAAHLSKVQPFFALASTLTLYAHEVQDYGDIARLFDFLLAQEAAVAVYFFAVIILSRKRELLVIPVEETDMLHFTLSKIPRPLDLETLIERTVDLFSQHRPEDLPFKAWDRVSKNSVLKTTRSAYASAKTKWKLEEGKFYFQRQALQLRRQEFRQRMASLIWHHRGTIGGLSIALFVGAISIWLQRQPLEAMSPSVSWARSRLIAFLR